MEKETENRYQKKICTIPNLLSLVRLLMIPLIMWLFFAKQDMKLTTLMLVLSGLTDIVDGFVARRFHMVSDLGKVLDPVADKLTQIAVLICLVTRFPYMMIPLVLLLIKEIFAAVTGAIAIYKTKVVMGADWHGKATTASLYTMMIIHLVWINIPMVVSNIIIALCIGIMLLSFVLYAIRNIRIIAGKEEKHA